MIGVFGVKKYDILMFDRNKLLLHALIDTPIIDQIKRYGFRI